MHQRHIIVAISGGIAAYKGAELVRLLKKQGAVVRVILSRGAKEFITPLTLQALSGEPTHSELLDETAEAGMGHICWFIAGATATGAGVASATVVSKSSALPWASLAMTSAVPGAITTRSAQRASSMWPIPASAVSSSRAPLCE